MKGRALLHALIMAAVAGIFFYRRHPIPGTILAVLADLILTAAFLAPSFFPAFALNMKYFGYLDRLTMTNDRFAELFGGPAHKAES